MRQHDVYNTPKLYLGSLTDMIYNCTSLKLSQQKETHLLGSEDYQSFISLY